MAGPGCIRKLGYSGYQISVEEMKGCRAVQCLMKKGSGWRAEADDQDFELESNYFLTGLGDGSPDESPLMDIIPARHGVEELLILNFDNGVCIHLLALFGQRFLIDSEGWRGLGITIPSQLL